MFSILAIKCSKFSINHRKLGVSREVANAFLKDEEIVEKIIPPGAKGGIRGAEFNRIVKDFILALRKIGSKYPLKKPINL